MPDMAMSAPKRLGKYEVLEVVGRGGMGVVYKAIDHEIGRLVGIKMMTRAVINDPMLLKRFYREAQSAGKLQHPNIVTIYDLGVQEATPYIVMEFLEGESLDAAIRSGRALSLEDKLNIVIQICNALAYAHEQSIIHRDIKPGNVMLLKDGTVKLVDFGIARIGAEYVTRSGQLMGSIQYMSPEQIHGTSVDLRTDIFSAGVLLYQLMTYVLPFEGNDAGDSLLKIIHNSAPPLSQFLPAYPPELDSIVHRVLAKNPDERYQTAAELAFDLSQVQEQLKRVRVAEHLQAAEQSVAAAQWSKAKEQLLQLLKRDRQNARANELLREVQLQIQKQQRCERIKDLQSQAEQAVSRNAFDEALRYLDEALRYPDGSAGVDETTSQLRELRDSIKVRKQRADSMTELLARAKSAFDTEDLENALATAQQALSVDADSPDAKELHAAIAKEVAERRRLKQIQTFLDEARKHISARHFTAALDVLRKAESVDPNAPGVNELVSMASTAQQQERRRKELEQISETIEQALEHNDYAAACAKADEGLERFPNERGLLKLKGLTEKKREASEKRMYVESQVSLARRLLEEKKSAEALVPVKEALGKYPDEFVLQSMYSLITDYIERDRAEQFRAKVTQQAKEAIRRKAYPEAIEILQAAQKETSSGEFDDLLQFTQEEAANYAIRQKIDEAAEQANRLMSADEYERAIDLLEATLREVDDQELRIILEDVRRHIEEFNADLEESVATVHRLLHVQRYNEALRFLENHAARFGKRPEFFQMLEQVHQEQRCMEAFSVVKEQAREALHKSDFGTALALLDKYCVEFGSSLDTDLLQQEIGFKRSEAARTTVAQALKDCRILLLVGCYQAVLDILDRAATAVAFVSGEMKQEYEFARASAITGVNRERIGNERFEKIKQRLAQGANDGTINDSQWLTAPSEPDKNPGPETQIASVAQLEDVLGEVTLIAKHYPGDRKIQSAVGDVRQQLTMHIAALKQGDVVQEVGDKAPPKQTKTPEPETRSLQPPVQTSQAAAETSQARPEPQRERPHPSNAPVPSPREHSPFGQETVISRVEAPATATRPSLRTYPKAAPALKKPIKPLPRQLRTRLKKTPALVVVAVLLLALIGYLLWKMTHPITSGVGLVEIKTHAERTPVRVSNNDNFFQQAS
jgi:eukaryotic-like serine/threonine-protein kinase